MDYYKLPDGYSCIDVVNDDTLYAYLSNRRDTYRLNGFKWEKTAETSYSYGVACNYGFKSGYYVPHDHSAAMILPAILVVLAIFHIILNFFKGIHGHV